MWGTSNNYPSIWNYEQAKETYDEIKPMRGTTDLRPLDRRSANAKSRIRKAGDNYVITLYRTDILTYYPNGDIHVCSGGYNSQSTRAAISAMSPIGAFNSQGSLAVSARDTNLKAGMGSFMMKSKGLLFKRDGEGNLRPVDPPVAFENKVRVKKVEAREKRKYFKSVPKLIEVYSAAFVGGEVTTAHIPKWDSYSDPVLDEVDATAIAMQYVQRLYDHRTRMQRYVNNPKAGIAAFWKDVYQHYELNERYQVELPYGEVA
jgi:hypothetical protein